MECRSYNLPGNTRLNYMLANNRTDSDRAVRKKGVSLKRVTSTHERGTLYPIKG